MLIESIESLGKHTVGRGAARAAAEKRAGELLLPAHLQRDG